MKSVMGKSMKFSWERLSQVLGVFCVFCVLGVFCKIGRGSYRGRNHRKSKSGSSARRLT